MNDQIQQTPPTTEGPWEFRGTITAGGRYYTNRHIIRDWAKCQLRDYSDGWRVEYLPVGPNSSWSGSVDCLRGEWRRPLTEGVVSTDALATGTEARVCADIAERQRGGVAKYGTTVADSPLHPDEWDMHHYQELLDAAVYQRRRMDFNQTPEGRKESIIRSIGRCSAHDGFDAVIDAVEDAMMDYRAEGMRRFVERMQGLLANHHEVKEPSK